MLLGKIEGQRLNLAKMFMANYCLALAHQAGGVDVGHVVRQMNHEYKLVPIGATEALVQDVQYFFDCLANQQITSVDRAAYWKWRAMSAFAAKQDLERELKALAE